MSVPPNVPRGSYGPKGPLPPSFPWGGMMSAPPMIPKLYWDAYSDEQRMKELWRCFDQIADRVNQLGYYYIPAFAGTWIATQEYPPLTVVEAPSGIEGVTAGDSYTALDWVPVGTPLTDETYWARTGNYNAQVAELQQTVDGFDARITSAETTANNAMTEAGKKAPIYHASADGTYGLASPTLNGHTKLYDAIGEQTDGAITPAAVKGALESAESAFDQALADAAPLFGPTIAPSVMGTDFIPNIEHDYALQYACLCKHGTAVYGFAAQNDTANTVYTRTYDIAANTITKGANVTAGHANSCLYDDADGVIVVCWGYSTPSVTDDKRIVALNPANFSQIAVATTNQHYHAITYDSHSGKAYGLTNWDYDAMTCDIYELGLSEFAKGTGQITEAKAFSMSFAAFGSGHTLQDMCVNNGVFYLSTASGYIGTFTQADPVIRRVVTCLQIDNSGEYYLNEIEGMEFDDADRLVAAFTFDCSDAGVMAFTTQLNTHDVSLSYNTTHTNSRTYFADPANQTKFRKAPYDLMSLAQLACHTRWQDANKVSVATDTTFVDPGVGTIAVQKALYLEVNGSLEIPTLKISSPVFELFCAAGSKLKIRNDDSGASAYVFSISGFCSAQSYDIRGTYTKNVSTMRDLQNGYNKLPITFGQLPDGFSFAETGAANPTEFGAYMSGSYKFTLTSNSA